MTAIVFQTSKQTEITYAYESVSYWDKEKQQSRAKRKCIGRLDSVTNEIVPTCKRVASAVESKELPAKRGPIPTVEATRGFYGATYLCDEIGEKLGLISDLRACFPDTYKQILSTAYYLIMEDKNPLSRFPKWATTHKHPYGNNSSVFKENAALRMNFGHMIQPTSPVIRSA